MMEDEFGSHQEVHVGVDGPRVEFYPDFKVSGFLPGMLLGVIATTLLFLAMNTLFAVKSAQPVEITIKLVAPEPEPVIVRPMCGSGCHPGIHPPQCCTCKALLAKLAKEREYEQKAVAYCYQCAKYCYERCHCK